MCLNPKIHLGIHEVMLKCARVRRVSVLFLFSLISVRCFAAIYVIPTANASAEGNSSDNAPLGSSEQHFQQVFNASMLTDIPAGYQIVGLGFRVNGGATAVPAQTVPRFDIRLSESLFAPGSLSSVFANNRGSDDTLVHSGQLVIQAGQFPGGSSPNAFGMIPFNGDPYYYNGGNLLIEVAFQGFTTGRDADAVYPFTAGQAQTAFGTGYGSTTADIGMFNEAIVFALDVEPIAPVPEHHVGLLAAGIAGIAIAISRIGNRRQGGPVQTR